MKLIIGKQPPYWFIIRRMFPHASLKKQIFAFGDTVYAPAQLPPDLIAHEETHLKQMGYSHIKAIAWWIRYWLSNEFRYRMELEACKKQMLKAMQIEPNRKKIRDFIPKLAKNLSSEVYNNCVSYEQAARDLGGAFMLGKGVLADMSSNHEWR